MGKKQKAKLLKAQNKQPTPYTEDERSTKVTRILIQLMQLEFDQYLTTEVRAGLDSFIKTGEDYIYDHNIPQISRIMRIHFVNDKNREKENSINMIFNRIRIQDDTDPQLRHKVNELNEAQENMFKI